MRYIDTRALLNELRAVERRYIEVCSCHRDDPDAQAAIRHANGRLAAFNELESFLPRDSVFFDDDVAERCFRATLDLIRNENGRVNDPHFSHIELGS